MEEEANGQQMLPISFLRQLIGLYGNSMQSLMPQYLEASMENFRANQSRLSEFVERGIGNNPIAKIAETNLALMRVATEALLPGRKTDRPSQPATDGISQRARRNARTDGGDAGKARPDVRIATRAASNDFNKSEPPLSNTKPIRHALSVKRADDFAKWYQAVIAEGDLAEESGVRGCMVIKPWGYGIWERIQHLLDRRIKAAGHENCYFPLFIPLANFEREAAHVDGFAKEMAVVTHHRLIADGEGGLIPDPDAKLEEPLVVRPTSETIIGDAMARWVQSWRDLPLLTNQWANVVRWEMRTRMFLRTSEFLWQEGHTAHEDADGAREHTLRSLEIYRTHAEDELAMPVIAGEKPENERFPGAVETWSIEAMMQDGKALQAGTSHYLGTNFATAANIKYQDREEGEAYCHTTSFGASTRLIGGLIMVHGDDDGLRVPPAIAPYHIVILPMLRGKDEAEDAELITYCERLRDAAAAQDFMREPVRVMLDVKPGKAAAKRWDWVRKGAPVIVEVGGRDMEAGKVSMLRRDALWNASAKPEFTTPALDDCAHDLPELLTSIQRNLLAQATERRDTNIVRDIIDMDALRAFYGADRDRPGWVEVQWAKPTGAALERVVEQLKEMKLTVRNVPRDAEPADGPCIFTGAPAVERVFVARAY